MINRHLGRQTRGHAYGALSWQAERRRPSRRGWGYTWGKCFRVYKLGEASWAPMQHPCIPAPQPCMWSDLLFQALTPDFSAVLNSAKRLGFEVGLCSLWLPLSERFVTMIGQVPKTDSHEAQHSRLTDEETGGGGWRWYYYVRNNYAE